MDHSRTNPTLTSRTGPWSRKRTGPCLKPFTYNLVGWGLVATCGFGFCRRSSSVGKVLDWSTAIYDVWNSFQIFAQQFTYILFHLHLLASQPPPQCGCNKTKHLYLIMISLAPPSGLDWSGQRQESTTRDKQLKESAINCPIMWWQEPQHLDHNYGSRAIVMWNLSLLLWY